ncbi:TPA: zinc metalloprotease HtpX [Candidatus Woesearchaeota archaeon]|nr:zinc metalloprotease HtpX [Candidatus Woesearchaeota archaeon]
MNFYEQIASNQRKTWLLMFFFIVVVAALGYVFGYVFADAYFGIVAAFTIAVVMAMIGYYSGDRIVLSISRARPASKAEFPHLVNSVEGLAIAAGIPMPKVYVIDDPALNAFATGRDPKHASVAVTSGLLARMNRQELEGVLAHELSHVKNFDMRLMTLAAVLVGVVALLSDIMLRGFIFGRRRDRREAGQLTAIFMIVGFLLALLAPLIAQMIKLAISRKREFLADASGAMLTRYPKGLADALGKIAHDNYSLSSASNATAHLYISNPFKRGEWMSSLFSTHPPIQERIKALEAM